MSHKSPGTSGLIRTGNSLKTTIRVGYWSALATGLLALARVIALVVQSIISPPSAWSGIEDYARSFNWIKMLNLILALPLGWAYIVMLASVHLSAPNEKKIWSILALLFGVIYATMANINYFILLVAVRLSLQSGEAAGLGLWVFGVTLLCFLLAKYFRGMEG